MLVAVIEGDEDQAIGQLQGFAHGLCQTRLHGALFGGRLTGDDRVGRGFQQHTINDGFNVVVLAAVQSKGLRKIANLTVHAGTKPLLINLIQKILKLALAAPHNGRHHGHALAFAQFQDPLHNLLGGLASDGPAAVGAVGRAH